MIISMSSKKKKKKKNAEEIVRKGLKRSAGFSWSLLVNIIIVFLVIKVFSGAFNFTYSVFGDAAKDPASREYVVVEIPADSSVLEIGAALEDKGIIDSKYVFFAKVRVMGMAGDIKAGKYGLSASMTQEEILRIICGISNDDTED